MEIRIWSQSAKFPQSSVALQVNIVVVTHPVVDELVPTRDIDGVPQLSVAVMSDEEGVGVVLHGRVSGPGQ